MKSGPKLSAILPNAAVQRRCSGGLLSAARLAICCPAAENRTGEPPHDRVRCGAGTKLGNEAAEDDSSRSSCEAAKLPAMPIWLAIKRFRVPRHRLAGPCAGCRWRNVEALPRHNTPLGVVKELLFFNYP